MAKRKSIHIEGFKHTNPIPNASRIGNLVMSGVILGRDPATGDYPPSLDEQARLCFGYIRDTVEAAGGTIDDVIKITIWMKDPGQRGALNDIWVETFPDEHSRPARHTLPDMSSREGIFIQCDFTAWID